MTDISPTAPNTTRRFSLPRSRFPWLAIGALLSAMSRLIGDAFTMAYVTPYTHPPRQPPIVSDDELGGRDASW